MFMRLLTVLVISGFALGLTSCCVQQRCEQFEGNDPAAAHRPCPPKCCKSPKCKITTLEYRRDLWGPRKVEGPYTRRRMNKPRPECLIEEAPPPAPGKNYVRAMK